MIWAFNFRLKEFIETSSFIEFGIDSQQNNQDLEKHQPENLQFIHSKTVFVRQIMPIIVLLANYCSLVKNLCRSDPEKWWFL